MTKEEERKREGGKEGGRVVILTSNMKLLRISV